MNSKHACQVSLEPRSSKQPTKTNLLIYPMMLDESVPSHTLRKGVSTSLTSSVGSVSDSLKYLTFDIKVLLVALGVFQHHENSLVRPKEIMFCNKEVIALPYTLEARGDQE